MLDVHTGAMLSRGGGTPPADTVMFRGQAVDQGASTPVIVRLDAGRYVDGFVPIA